MLVLSYLNISVERKMIDVLFIDKFLFYDSLAESVPMKMATHIIDE